MMRTLVRLCIKNPMIVNIFFVGIIVIGALVTYNTRREIFPSMTMDIVNINIPYPGASAEEVEEGVTIKVEEAIQGITGIDYITSTSVENYSSIYVFMKTSVDDPRKVFEDIKDKVDQIFTFPEDAEEPNITLVEHMNEVIAVSIYGDTDLFTLKTIAEDVRDDLLEFDDVSRIDETGVMPRELIIELSEESLQRYGITFNEVVAAVRNYDLDVSGGSIRTDTEDLSLRARGRNYRADTLEDIVLRALPDGTVIRLRDVAKVVEDFAEVNYSFRFNRKPAVSLMVMKTEEDDALKIADSVKKYIEEHKADMPPGVSMDYWADDSVILRQRIDLLVKNAKYAVVLIFVILLVFLGMRLSFWVAAGLPVSVMGTMILMQSQDVTINMISLFAFITVLGILVDDAIVVSENIQQYIEKGYSPEDAAVEGTVEVTPAVLASVTTTMIAFSPFLFVEGVWGKFLYPVPVVSIFGLLVSLFECFFILPAHLAHSLRPYEEQQAAQGLGPRLRRATDRAIRGVVDSTYKPAVRFTMRHRWKVFAFGIALFLVSIGVVMSGRIKFVFFPSIDSDWVSVTYTLEPGSSMEVQKRAAGQIAGVLDQLNEEYMEKRRELLETPEGARKFGAMDADSPFIEMEIVVMGGTPWGGRNDTKGQVFIEMIEGESRGFSSKEVSGRWRELIGDVPGVMRLDVDASIGPSGVDVVEVQLRGESMDELRLAAADVKQKMREYPGVFEVQDSLDLGKREVRLVLTERGRALGFTLAGLISQVRSGFYGSEIHRIQRGRDEMKVWVRYPENERNSIADLESIKVRTPSGDSVPLIEVAEFDFSRQLRSISRFDRRRVLTVKGRVDSDVITPEEFKGELRSALPAILGNVQGVSYSFEGQDRSQQQMGKSLGKWYQIAMLVIFIVIAVTFRNYLHSFIIMLLIPMGFVGAVVGHLVTPYLNPRIDRMDLTFLSIAGVVALAGIVVNDSIVMIHAIKRNLGQEGMPLYEAVFEGAVSRFRPIVLTTFTTSIGLMPLVLEQSLQAQFLIPMACSIAFGLLVSTFFTQVWLPATFLVLNDLKRTWYMIARGRLYTPTTVELNALPSGNFIKGLVPGWMIILLVVVAAAVALKTYVF